MRNWYQRGSANAICDVCGEKFKLSQLMKRWDGLWVCSQDYEERHPQDFLRARKETLHLPITKPRPADTLVEYCTIFGKIGVAGTAVAGCAITANMDNFALIVPSPITPAPIPDTSIHVTIADNGNVASELLTASQEFYRTLNDTVVSSELVTPSITYYGAIAGIAIAGFSISGAY